MRLPFPVVDPIPASERSRRIWEVVIVLALSLGYSAIWSLVVLADRLSRVESLSQQTATLNPSASDRELFDFLYQLLPRIFDLAPVVLVCWIAWRAAAPRLGALGLSLDRPLRDTGWGALLVLVIGVPGLALYLAGRAADLTVTVVPSPLDQHWWTVPMLILSAIRAGVTEEVIVVGYLFWRLRGLGWGPWAVIVWTSVLRAAYHSYQGIGSIIGNFLMGLLFGWLYARFGRLLPLVIAHILIDVAVFVGYPLAYHLVPALFA